MCHVTRDKSSRVAIRLRGSCNHRTASPRRPAPRRSTTTNKPSFISDIFYTSRRACFVFFFLNYYLVILLVFGTFKFHSAFFLFFFSVVVTRFFFYAHQIDRVFIFNANFAIFLVFDFVWFFFLMISDKMRSHDVRKRFISFSFFLFDSFFFFFPLIFVRFRNFFDIVRR